MRTTFWAGVVALCSAIPGLASAQSVNLFARDLLADTEVLEGGVLELEVTLVAQGLAAPGPFHWTAYLTTGGIMQGALPIGTFGPVSLGAGGETRLRQSVSLPPAVTGLFHVAVVVDALDEVSEQNEYDNQLASSRVTRVRPIAVDLAVESATRPAGSHRAGGPIDVPFVLRNRGELPATVSVAAYLSRDPIVSTSDIFLGDVEISIPAGGRVMATVPGVIPADLAAGSYTVGVIADPHGLIFELDERNNVGAADGALVVHHELLAIETGDLPEATLRVPWELLLEASGGDGVYVWSLASGELPLGLNLEAQTGRLFGTPTRTGRFAFDVRVESRGQQATRAFEVLVADQGLHLQIANRTAANGFLHRGYEQLFVAGGGEEPYEWEVNREGGELPPGLDLNRSGVLSGRPTTIGTFTFGLTVRDRHNATDSAQFTVRIAPATDVTVLPKTIPTLAMGEAMEVTLDVTGGTPPYTWRALSTPPPGLVLTENGRIRGTPSLVGRFPFRVQASDAKRRVSRDSTLLQIEVQEAGVFEIVTTALPPAVLRSHYEVALEAEGGTPPLKWRLVPGTWLPDGFHLVEGDGERAPVGTARIYGRGFLVQHHAFMVRVEDAAGRRREVPLALTVEFPAGSGPGDGGCRCAAPRAGTGLGALLLLGLTGLLAARRRR